MVSAIFTESILLFKNVVRLLWKKINHFDGKFYWAYPIYSLDNYLKLLSLIDFYVIAIKQAQTSVVIFFALFFLNNFNLQNLQSCKGSANNMSSF